MTLAAFLLPAGRLSPILSSFSLRERPPFLDLALRKENGKKKNYKSSPQLCSSSDKMQCVRMRKIDAAFAISLHIIFLWLESQRGYITYI